MSGNADNIILGPAAVFIGTAGVEPATSAGYTSEEGAGFELTAEELDVFVGEKTTKVKKLVTQQMAKITCTLLEVTLTTLAALTHGATKSGDTITGSASNTTAKEVSVKIVGQAPDGSVRTFRMLYATPRLTGPIPQNARNLVTLPVEFDGVGVVDTLYTISEDATELTATLATGDLTRVGAQVYHRVAGEGGAADALTDIVADGTALADGELVILAIADEGDPITVTHATGVIELDGDADWVMTDLDDRLWLTYDLSGTKWDEVGRYNARSDL